MFWGPLILAREQACQKRQFTTSFKAHTAEQPLKLYSGWFCPFVQRVWAVLEEKQIPYTYIEVNPYHKPDSLLQLNPRGLVPTLQVPTASGGVAPLYESTVVCEYLDETYPDHGPRLLPAHPYERARMRIWIDWITSRFLPSFHRLLQCQDAGAMDGARKELAGLVKDFARELDPKGPFFLGEQPALIDFVLAPWAVRMWVFDHFKGGAGLPGPGEGGEDEQLWARWRKWTEAIGERRSVRQTTSEREHYLPIYQRYADDKAQSEMAKSIRAGRGVP